MTTRSQLLSSAVAFALACLVVITVHELGHVLGSLAQGRGAVLYGFSVDDDALTDRQEIVTALAGPLVSLLTGVAVLATPRSRLPPFWRLTVLWTGLLSVQEFSGYLITGPFAHVGDIGAVLDVTGAPAAVGWLGFVVGWVTTYLVGQHAVRGLVGFTSPSLTLAPQLRALGLFAWLIGAGLVIALSAGLLTAGGVAGGVVVFEALGVLSSGIFLIFVRVFLRGLHVPVVEPDPLPPTPWAGIVVLVLVVLARQLALAGGIDF